MRSFRLLLVIFLSSPFVVNAVPFWGKTGHRVVGEVAEQHLKPQVRKEVLRLLQMSNLAEVSTFSDEIKSDDRYWKYDVWHYVNLPFDATYESYPKNPKGDIIVAIDTCLAVLRDKQASDEDKSFHLKFLIHLVGDLHQPMHIGRAEDKGGNDIQARWFSRGTNLHRIWDSDMIEEYGMSYTELAGSLPVLSKEQKAEIMTGTHRDWMEETHKLTPMAYASVEIGEKLGYRYMYDHFQTVEVQLQKAGLRLAYLLNSVF